MAGSDGIDADDTLEFVDSFARRMLVRVVSVFALCVYIGYLVYRALYTINYDAIGFSLLVYFAEVHGFFSLFFDRASQIAPSAANQTAHRMTHQRPKACRG